MPDDISPQEFGRLQAEVLALRRDQDRQTELLERVMHELSEIRINELGGIKDQLSEAKGGWRMLMALGGASATAGAVIGPYVSRIFKLLS